MPGRGSALRRQRRGWIHRQNCGSCAAAEIGGSGNLQVEAAGVGGARATDPATKERLETRLKKGIRDRRWPLVRAVVLILGINDAGKGISAQAISTALEGLKQTALAADGCDRVFVCTMYHETYLEDQIYAVVNASIIGMEDVEVVDLGFGIELAADGVHPSKDGYQQIAGAISAAFVAQA